MRASPPSTFFLVSFATGHLANDWAPAAIWLLAPAFAVAFDLSPAELGLLLTIHSVGAALAYVPAGLLADRVSDRGRLLLFTFWWVGAGYLLASLANDYWTLAILLALAGLGDAAWHPIATGVLVQQLPRRRAHALGVHAMGGTLAEVLAPLSVGSLLAFVDWQTALRVSAVPALLMGAVFIFVARRIPLSTERRITGTDLVALWRIWRHPSGLRMVAMISTYNMALFALLSMTPLFLLREHAYSTLAAGGVFSVMLLVGALVQPLVGRVSDRVGRKPVVVVGASLAAVAVLLAFAVSKYPMAFVPALVVSTALLVGIRAAILAAAVEFVGQRESTTLGLVFALMDGVGALGAVLAGAVGSVSLHYVFALTGALAICSLTFAARMQFVTQDKPIRAGTTNLDSLEQTN